MKFKDLLNIEKAIAEKNSELEEKKIELEKIIQEAEKLKLMIEINSKQNEDDMIDISDVYYYHECDSNVVYFVKTRNEPFFCLVDIFSPKIINFCTKSNFAKAKIGLNPSFEVKHIKELYPEVIVYLNDKVPKLLLQKLYYEANGIDEKVLKRSVMKN